MSLNSLKEIVKEFFLKRLLSKKNRIKAQNQVSKEEKNKKGKRNAH
jgi:hypothetical protein